MTEKLAFEINNATSITDNLIHSISLLSNLDRWRVLSRLLETNGRKSVHFLHVPKTGGTTFGESLAADGKATVISVDSHPKVFARQLLNLTSSNSRKFVLTRAHHSLKLISKSGAMKNTRFIITAYRDPIDIHISMIHMIMKRLSNYYAGKNMSELETVFCENWISKLGTQFESTADFALSLINSNAYLKSNGGIYARFFDMPNWHRLIKDEKLAVINYTDFDLILTGYFGYPEPPKRRNVNKNIYIGKEYLSEEKINLLTKTDRDIAKYLYKHLTLPQSLAKHFANAL